MAKANWQQMMNAMNEVDGGSRPTSPRYGGGQPAPNTYGDDPLGLSEVTEEDTYVPPPTPDINFNKPQQPAQPQQGGPQKFKTFIPELDSPPPQQHPQPMYHQPLKKVKIHKSSMECYSMYQNMEAEKQQVLAESRGYTPPPNMRKPQSQPRPVMENTTYQQPPPQQSYSYGGSLLDEVRKANSPVTEGHQHQKSGYAAFIEQDVTRKRAAISAIYEKLNEIDINTCEPDKIIAGVTNIINRLYGK